MISYLCVPLLTNPRGATGFGASGPGPRQRFRSVERWLRRDHRAAHLSRRPGAVHDLSSSQSAGGGIQPAGPPARYGSKEAPAQTMTAAQPPRAVPEVVAEFAEFAQLLPIRDSVNASSILQDYIDGSKSPQDLCGSILIIGGGTGTAEGARFARVKTKE